jgi:uncharacterized protein YbjT (DUF2867 family)
MRISVIGGSGLIGTRLVSLMKGRGHDVVAASRATGVDAITGEGLAEAVAGAEVVVDVANTRSLDGQGPLKFFQALSQNLAAAENTAGVLHHVGLSIVGVDRVRGSYFNGKAAQEEIVRASPVHHTIVRSTQFFELVERVLSLSAGQQLVRLPPALVQPIASDDVVETLADIASSPPLDATIELAGPETMPLSELARLMLSARQDPRRIIPDTSATFFGATLGYQSLTAGPDARTAPSTFGDWLRQQITAD